MQGLGAHLALSTDFLVSLPGFGRWLAASRWVSRMFALGGGSSLLYKIPTHLSSATSPPASSLVMEVRRNSTTAGRSAWPHLPRRPTTAPRTCTPSDHFFSGRLNTGFNTSPGP